MTRRRWLLPIIVVVAIIAIAPAYIRAYRVDGHSDAPSFLVDDRIIANKAAYDVRLPYTDVVVFPRSGPQPGDVVILSHDLVYGSTGGRVDGAGTGDNTIVLDRDIMQVPDGEIPAVRVVQTWVGGKRVFSR